jgi:hypothetical protein
VKATRAPVISLDRAGVRAEEMKHPRSFWASKPAGTTVPLTMADGSVRSLMLENCF